ncbi:MAG: glycoside hydrolase family 2 TIM barrel-domain containing protein [Bifidobacterium scardovii]|uniref:glycoside hydrolase family 2 TIM barrel-domain containing protein n=1 Tax=Bifidobacterium scardovii TaxID=158787 RepID=UPI0029017532|nr:glycoside hydrolase family 2 TIM barrel-domain containing protein [Bifidobacterium scardovii]MDU2422810.1 glycoside hydrolase family 2 TIM barrel-domain containing protein [Bifidobacterium scardovii]
MHAIEFNHDWSYRHLGAASEPFVPVTIPHDAMIGEKRSPLAASGFNSGWFEGRDYEYVRRFTPHASLAGSTMILEFEGVYHNAEVWINGERAAFCPYGYTNFTVDVTDRLIAGRENEIRVIARNADQPNSRWYSGAGIYRPVTLWVAPREYIALDGVTVCTLSIGSPDAADGERTARVRITVDTTAAGTVSVDVRRHAGAPASADDSASAACGQAAAVEGAAENGSCRAVLELDIPGARLWSPDRPNLYAAHIRYRSERTGAVDDADVTFGIREIAWGSGGFKINGERVIIQGACLHHDNGILGACAYADAEERKIALMKANGYNAVRSAHNPCSKALLDACDRLGVLVMDEYIDHWYIHKTQHDYVDYFDEWWRRDLTDMVVKDRNHPSVILYSTGNEVSETAQKRGIALTREMTGFLHRLDPARPVTCGVNIFFDFLNSIGFGRYSDERAAKEAVVAERRRAAGETDGRHKAVGSEFFNTMAGVLGADFMKTGAALPFCDRVTRGAFAAMDVAGYNYGIKRYRHDLRKYPRRLILGSETFCSDAYRFRELAKRNPRLIGDFVWSGMDYLGETGVGAWEYEDYASLSIGYGWLTAGSGRIDLTGKPLGEARYTQVALEAAAGPFIAVCPVNHTGDRHSSSAWKMSHAVESWSWNGCDGRKANVEVYARAATVALLVNGREVGRRSPKRDCIVRFSCTYEPGSLEAIAYDADGREIGRHALVSASDRTELRAELEWVAGMVDDACGDADGRPVGSSGPVGLVGSARSSARCVRSGRLAFVRVRYTDEHGITKPLERGTLRASVTGGDLLGFGCAAPCNRGSFVTGETGTYYGEALAVVRAGEDAAPGDVVTVNVTDGAHTAALTVPVG